MKAYTLLFSLLISAALPAYAQQTKKAATTTQKETVVINRAGSGSTTIEITANGVYVDGEQVATKADLSNKNINKRIIINEGSSAPSDYDYSYSTPSPARRAMLGVLADASRSYDGAYIQSVTANSPAASAGLREGDIILKIDTAAIYTPDDLVRVVRRYNPGDRVTVRYRRDGRDRQTTATLAESADQGWSRVYEVPRWRDEPMMRPMPPMMDNKPRLGITVEDLADGEGVRIIRVTPGSPADESDLRRNDVITYIGNTKVETVSDLERVTRNLHAGTNIKVELLRDSDRISRTLIMPKPRSVKDL